jgi:hypothetical protein
VPRVVAQDVLVVGIERERPRERDLRARSIPVEGLPRTRDGKVRVWELIIDGQRPGGSRPGNRVRVAGWEYVEQPPARQRVRERKRRVAVPVVRVAGDAPFEACARRGQRLTGPLPPVVQALEIEVVSLGVAGARAGYPASPTPTMPSSPPAWGPTRSA